MPWRKPGSGRRPAGRREGTVPLGGPVRVVERHALGVTVFDAHRAALPSASNEEAERVLAVAALAGEWRQMVGG